MTLQLALSWILLLVATVASAMAQQQEERRVHNINNSIWDSLTYANGSKTLMDQLDQMDNIEDVLSQNTTDGITFFLPTEAAVQAALANHILNFTLSNTTFDQLLHHIVPNIYDTTSLLSRHQYLTTNDSSYLPLVAGPDPANTSMVAIASGPYTAHIVNADIRCSNGIIHVIDQFLAPPKTTLETIAQIPELQSYDQLIQSLNLTGIVTGNNKTIIAASNQAWEDANGATMPYGTLVHNLKYQVIPGIYLASTLFPSSGTNNDVQVVLSTEWNARRDHDHAAELHFCIENATQYVQGRTGDDQARVLRTDIVTTEGVIHIVDKVLSADRQMTSTTLGSSINSGGGASPARYDSGDDDDDGSSDAGGGYGEIVPEAGAQSLVSMAAYMSEPALTSVLIPCLFLKLLLF
ncbi:FAS1 domain-containing protein [Syncephalastrum racemosum]|uniref:FAS1 domain-containing protein n=1 Tax=Syncephalastrum racemosum TaxID=13706 RepID=A0A1X2HW92_SYNRA|nr:FAS1 domain-containing protein [Syncephalastrum racemosum]